MKLRRIAACVLGCMLFTALMLPAAVAQELEEAELVPLKDLFSDYFRVGTAIGRADPANEELKALMAQQFNMITAGNEMKPQSLFDITASRRLALEGDEDNPVISINYARPVLNFAKESGMYVHGHTLLWHSQTPRELFTEGYLSGGELLGRERMLVRMENYIKNVMEAIDREYPGLVLSWDVVNEAVLDSGEMRGAAQAAAGDDNGVGDDPPLWYLTVGADYVEKAFEFARKYAPENTRLFYNDFNVPTGTKSDGIIKMIEPIMEAGNIDGIGFQSHYSSRWPALSDIDAAFQRYVDLGLTIKVTELDITIQNNESFFKAQADRYYGLFKIYTKYAANVESVTFWGVTDDRSWRASQYPLIFDAEFQPKQAYWSIVNGSYEAPPEEALYTTLPMPSEESQTPPLTVGIEPVIPAGIPTVNPPSASEEPAAEPTVEPAATAEPDEGGGGLGTAAIIAIVLGALCLVAAVLLVRRKKQR